MINNIVYKLIKDNIITKDVSNRKKRYNHYVFAGETEEGDYNYSILFPRFVVSRNIEWNESLKKSVVDIMYNRQGKKPKNLMISGRSSHLRSMWKTLDGVEKYREYICLIDDISLWRNCLCYYGQTEDVLMSSGNRSAWYRNYSSWDLYLPLYHLIIELDSDFHKTVGIDMARDRYFDLRYGIKTERFWEYSKATEGDKVRISNIIHYGKFSESFIPDQYSILISEYIKNNLLAVNVLSKVIDLGYSPDNILKLDIPDFKKKFGIYINFKILSEIYRICGRS